MESTGIAYNTSVCALYFLARRLDEAIDRIEILEEENCELQDRVEKGEELSQKWEEIAMSFKGLAD